MSQYVEPLLSSNNCVMVQNISDDISKAVLALYFENESWSGGRDVLDVKAYVGGYYLVYFEDPKGLHSSIAYKYLCKTSNVNLDHDRIIYRVF